MTSSVGSPISEAGCVPLMLRSKILLAIRFTRCKSHRVCSTCVCLFVFVHPPVFAQAFFVSLMRILTRNGLRHVVGGFSAVFHQLIFRCDIRSLFFQSLLTVHGFKGTAIKLSTPAASFVHSSSVIRSAVLSSVVSVFVAFSTSVLLVFGIINAAA